MDPNPITYFAETDARNKKIRFGIKESDRLRHVYVVGKTGIGKSTMLENMAIQDIQNGNGLAFIDPHGSTAEKFLDYVPENRIKDVLVFRAVRFGASGFFQCDGGHRRGQKAFGGQRSDVHIRKNLGGCLVGAHVIYFDKYTAGAFGISRRDIARRQQNALRQRVSQKSCGKCQRSVGQVFLG